MTDKTTALKKRIRIWTWIFIFFLVLSGVTAIPVKWEMDLLLSIFNPTTFSASFWMPLHEFLAEVSEGINHADEHYQFLFYGFDWLAFGHIVIAIAFYGLIKDPVRNKWLIQFGMIACVLIVPTAFFLGGMRGIPFFWKLVDCSFGLFGIIPLWMVGKWINKLEIWEGQEAN
ncbi:hypothetical protein KFE98_03265 [bacterium SCSIO 12741]|nr:hypothetical protein KFE98_03265 [bacterium SCSIO 12741]